MTESRQRCEALVVKAVDGLLTGEEQQELEALLEEHPEYRDELLDFVSIKESTDALRGRILEDSGIEAVRSDVTSRVLAGSGFWLLLASSLFLLGFAAWAFALDSTVPLSIKVAVGAGGAGLFALFLHVLRIRRRAFGHDPYREIDQ